MKYRINIDKDKLYELYVDQKKSMSEVGSLLGVHWQTISERIKDFGWKRSRKINIDKNFLYQKYCIDGFSSTDIAEMLNLNHFVVLKRLREYGWIRSIFDSHQKDIYKNKLVNANWGKKVSKETRLKLSLVHIGIFSKENHPMWKGGKPKCIDCNKQLSSYGYKRCNHCHLGFKGMSNLEIKTQKIINKYKLPYKFVGNGKFYIEKKCPDFVNTNGEKIAIEVYWKRHKDRFKNNGEEGWKKERESIFNKYGWRILFLEGTGLNENKIISKITEGGDVLFQ